MPHAPPSTPTLREIIKWDVNSWAQALSRWERWVPQAEGLRVLELGSHGGGISLYWAMRGSQVVCSDLGGPQKEALALHERYGVAERISYADIDATKIARGDGEFDVVCFKSVLGGVGGALGWEGQARALGEMHRVLRPGGQLIFAENTAASPLHRFLRRRFVEWGARWRYPTPEELRQLLEGFAHVELNFAGFAATFGRREWQRTLLYAVDVLVTPMIPDRWKYIAIGCATK